MLYGCDFKLGDKIVFYTTIVNECDYSNYIKINKIYKVEDNVYGTIGFYGEYGSFLSLHKSPSYWPHEIVRKYIDFPKNEVDYYRWLSDRNK